MRIAIAAKIICIGLSSAGKGDNGWEGVSCMVDGEYKCVSNEEASYIAA